MTNQLSLNRTTIIICFLLTSFAALIPHQSEAQVTINTAILSFRAGTRPVQTVTVGNSSKEVAYVVSSAEKVLDPESGGGKSEPTEDILVSPKNFSIEPEGQRAVRLLIRNQPKETEVVYRALFVPQDRGFGQEVRKEVQGRTASIRVLSGMGVLIFVEPPNPRKVFSWNRTANSITFSNHGNVHVEIAHGKSCNPLTETDCKAIDGKRVYPNSSHTIQVPSTQRLSFLHRLGAGAEYEQLVIEPGIGAGGAQATPNAETGKGEAANADTPRESESETAE